MMSSVKSITKHSKNQKESLLKSFLLNQLDKHEMNGLFKELRPNLLQKFRFNWTLSIGNWT
jgi:hypothetical protein